MHTLSEVCIVCVLQVRQLKARLSDAGASATATSEGEQAQIEAELNLARKENARLRKLAATWTKDIESARLEGTTSCPALCSTMALHTYTS